MNFVETAPAAQSAAPAQEAAPSVEIEGTQGATRFLDGLARLRPDRRAFISPLTADELTAPGVEAHLTSDGLAGYTIDRGVAGKPSLGFDIDEIGSLFNASGKPNVGESLMVEAISKGGNSVFFFDGYLREFYEAFGFRETKSEKWNPALAPANWDYNRYGTPDVVWARLPEGASRDAEVIRRDFRTAWESRLGESVSSGQGVVRPVVQQNVGGVGRGEVRANEGLPNRQLGLRTQLVRGSELTRQTPSQAQTATVQSATNAAGIETASQTQAASTPLSFEEQYKNLGAAGYHGSLSSLLADPDYRKQAIDFIKSEMTRLNKAGLTNVRPPKVNKLLAEIVKAKDAKSATKAIAKAREIIDTVERANLLAKIETELKQTTVKGTKPTAKVHVCE